jgi:hypothetical protein
VSQPNDSGRPGVDVFRIIVHASPPIDSGFTHWTEAPECPAAHDGGPSAEIAVNRTKDRIRAWRARHLDQSVVDGGVEFSIEEAF